MTDRVGDHMEIKVVGGHSFGVESQRGVKVQGYGRFMETLHVFNFAIEEDKVEGV